MSPSEEYALAKLALPVDISRTPGRDEPGYTISEVASQVVIALRGACSMLQRDCPGSEDLTERKIGLLNCHGSPIPQQVKLQGQALCANASTD